MVSECSETETEIQGIIYNIANIVNLHTIINSFQTIFLFLHCYINLSV